MLLPVLAPVVAVVNRREFTLHLVRYERRRARAVLPVEQTFSIAVGMVGHATSPGEYRVITRTRTPDWKAPLWADPPEIQGMIAPFWQADIPAMSVERPEAAEWPEGFIPAGVTNVPLLKDGDPVPNVYNPFLGGFISFEDADTTDSDGGQGFHSTKFDPRIGSRASHGCVRMALADFDAVYDVLLPGTLVVVI